MEIFRTTTCPSCGKDAHVCLNCRFYDKSAHMECRESIAEPVAQKDRSNFCEYFKVREATGRGPGSGPGPATDDRAARARDAAEAAVRRPVASNVRRHLGALACALQLG